MTDREKQLRRSDRIRIGIILALCLIISVPVVVAMAADPTTGPSDDPNATATATASAETPSSAAPSDETTPSDEAPSSAAPNRIAPAPDTTKPDPAKPGTGDKPANRNGAGFGFGGFGGGAGFGFGAISITAINGNNLSLKTDDGWTRTIAVGPDTKITKAGQPIKVADLDVGDHIRFAQKRGTDGKYTIVAITVPTDNTGGEVTAISGNTLTLKGRKDATQTVTLTGSTVYKVGNRDAKKSDVKVGSRVQVAGDAEGTTFTALTVRIQLTNVGGEVTAKTSDSLTIKGRDGKSVVVHVNGDTKYGIRGDTTPGLSDIAVGDKVTASGTQRADGSLDAFGVTKRVPRPERTKPDGAKPGKSPAASSGTQS